MALPKSVATRISKMVMGLKPTFEKADSKAPERMKTTVANRITKSNARNLKLW